MILAHAIGKRTQELLFKKNMTQYKLVKITCLNPKTVSDLIKCKTSNVNITTVYLIANALGMTISEFTNSPLFSEENIDL